MSNKKKEAMWAFPKVVAHRGGGKLAPENTLAGIRCGLEYGFHAVEFDVMLTADNVPILMHDANLGRTVSGIGSVANLAAETITAMDAGAWFDEAFRGEPVPTFAQAIEFCTSHQIWMNVEIKPVPGFEVQTGQVAGAMIKRVFATEISHHRIGVNDVPLPLLSSFSLDALMAAKAEAPEIPRAYLVDVIPRDWQASLVEIGAVALHVNHKNLTEALAREVKNAGYGLFCYTINNPARACEMIAWGVDAFCTDRIDIISADFFG